MILVIREMFFVIFQRAEFLQAQFTRVFYLKNLNRWSLLNLFADKLLGDATEKSGKNTHIFSITKVGFLLGIFYRFTVLCGATFSFLLHFGF